MQNSTKILVLAVLLSIGTAYGQTSDQSQKDAQIPVALEQQANASETVAPALAGMTPFMNAASSGKLAEVEALLKAGADVNFCPPGHWTPLMLAIMDNPDPEVVYSLIRAGAAVNARDANGCNSIIHAAMSNSHPEIITALIKAGGDFNCPDISSATPLIVAAGFSTNAEVVKVLINAGADLKARSKEGWSPLIAAAMNGNPLILSAILEAGADVNASNELDGRTALMVAAMSERSAPEKIQALLTAGAKVDLKDKDGKTALDYASENKHLTGTVILAQLEEATRRASNSGQ